MLANKPGSCTGTGTAAFSAEAPAKSVHANRVDHHAQTLQQNVSCRGPARRAEPPGGTAYIRASFPRLVRYELAFRWTTRSIVRPSPARGVSRNSLASTDCASGSDAR